MNSKEYFESYPKSNECFQTKDGFIFHFEHDAKAHEFSLKEKGIQHFERLQKQEVKEDTSEPVLEAKKKSKK